LRELGWGGGVLVWCVVDFGGSGALAQELDEGLSLREQPPCCLHRDVDLCVRVRVRVVYEDPALAVGCDALGLGNMWSD